MTYSIQRNNDVGPDKSALIQFLGSCFGVVSKPIIFNWSITQYDTVTEQLNGGIRYFDLRLAAKPNDTDTYFVHGLFGCEITQPLMQLDEWLTNHPNEIVILDFQHFYAFNEARHRAVVEKIKLIFQRKICPAYNKLDNVSLQWMNSMKYQVIVIYRNIIAKHEMNVWPNGFWPTPWPDTVNTDRLIEFLNKSLSERSRSAGFVSQCLLTPDVTYVMRHMFSNLHNSLGKKCQNVILNWIQEKQPGSGGLNIIIADYVSNNNFAFSKTVIQRNMTLLQDQYQYNNWQRS